jgi:splicing factor 3B subunit 3
MADNSIIQVHANGIRHIRPDKLNSEWKAPGKRLVTLASVNSRQVAISLSGGEIMYFEIDAAGMLTEMGSIDLGKEISSLDVGVVGAGRSRSMFLAAGCWDDTVQLLSLDPSDILGKGPSFSVESRPTSLCLIEMTKDTAAGTAGYVTFSSFPLNMHRSIVLQ